MALGKKGLGSEWFAEPAKKKLSLHNPESQITKTWRYKIADKMPRMWQRSIISSDRMPEMRTSIGLVASGNTRTKCFT